MTHPLVAAARAYLGKPYVWGGKRNSLFDLARLKLEPSPWLPVQCFDCSGVVTVSILDLGGPNWLGTHSAGTLRDVCVPVARGAEIEGDLLFRPRHVAIFVRHGRPGHVVVIEASGGDETTTTPFIAERQGAAVKEHEVPASYFTSAGRLPPHVVLPYSPLRKNT